MWVGFIFMSGRGKLWRLSLYEIVCDATTAKYRRGEIIKFQLPEPINCEYIHIYIYIVVRV